MPDAITNYNEIFSLAQEVSGEPLAQVATATEFANFLGDPIEKKALQFHSAKVLIDGIEDELPAIDAPSGPEAISILLPFAHEYLNSPHFEGRITTIGASTIAKEVCIDPVINSLTNTIDPTQIHIDAGIRIAMDGKHSDTVEELTEASENNDTNAMIETIGMHEIVGDALFGGSGMLIADAFRKAQGPLELRSGFEIIDADSFMKAAARAASLSIEELHAAFHGKGLLVPAKKIADSIEAGRPKLQDHDDYTPNKFSDISLGCPARHSQRLMQWSPQFYVSSMLVMNSLMSR